MPSKLLQLNARVEQISEFSVHADSTELIAWLATANEAPTNVFVVHGEAGVAESFSDMVSQKLGWKSRAPKDGDSVAL
jgi:metallo-beta-lactamase family protein